MLAAAAAGQADPVESPASTSNTLGFIGYERPDAESGPTRVTIALYIVDISRIDDVDLTATVDFHLRIEWNDPRLASEAGGVRVLDVDEIWTPTPQVANERRLFKTFDEVVRVAPDGHVMYRQRFHGTITTPLTDPRRSSSSSTSASPASVTRCPSSTSGSPTERLDWGRSRSCPAARSFQNSRTPSRSDARRLTSSGRSSFRWPRSSSCRGRRSGWIRHSRDHASASPSRAC
ncbi:MAG: ligand-gated ion channel [Planctomycetota bacterium]